MAAPATEEKPAVEIPAIGTGTAHPTDVGAVVASLKPCKPAEVRTVATPVIRRAIPQSPAEQDDAVLQDAIERLEEIKREKREIGIELARPYRVQPPSFMAKIMDTRDSREKYRQMEAVDDPRLEEMRDYEETQEGFDAPYVQLKEWNTAFRENIKTVRGLFPAMAGETVLDGRPVQQGHSIHRMIGESYEWYKHVSKKLDQASSNALGEAGRQKAERIPKRRGPDIDFYELAPEDLAADGNLPGSGFYGGHNQNDELEGCMRMSALLSEDACPGEDVPPQPPVAQLAPPWERLKQTKTKQVASPLMPRRRPSLIESLKLKKNVDHDYVDRPFTPSTTAGSSTARSLPASARSTPSPFPVPSRCASPASNYSRPVSATNANARGPELVLLRRVHAAGLSRPGTACDFSVPEHFAIMEGTLPPRPATVQDHVQDTGNNASRAGVLQKEPMTDAEIRMEERWLQYRHREIADQIIAEERRVVVREWSERRARIEEEISRNMEASRYQSELNRRGYSMPDDADDDIDIATGRPIPRNVKTQTETCDVPTYDVTTVQNSRAVRFHAATTPNMKKPTPPVSARSAYLRRIHQRLLQPPAKPTSNRQSVPAEGILEEEAGDEGAGEQNQGAIEDDGRILLSPYTTERAQGDHAERRPVPLRRPDDSDVHAVVCRNWQNAHGLSAQDFNPVDREAGLETIRFKQMQEIEAVKRVFSRWNRQIDAGVLERALVMPSHRVSGAGATLKGGASELPSNPFFKHKIKSKKKRNAKTKKKAKARK